MPTLVEDLSDGLQLRLVDGERLELVRAWDAQDLVGANPTAVFASAWSLTGVPTPNDYLDIMKPGGSLARVWPANYDLTPFPPADARLNVTYSERNLAILGASTFGKCTVSGDSTLQQIETEFDWDNLQKPFAQREPLFVEYTATGVSVGAGGGATQQQGGRVPMFLPRASRTFTRFERTYPGARQDDYSGKRNSDAFMGAPVGTLLMWHVGFDQIRSDLYSCSYTVVNDPYMKWQQVLRFVDPLSGKPQKLTQGQVAAQNGIKEVTTQGSIAFGALQIEIA